MGKVLSTHLFFLLLALATLIHLQLGTFANDPGVGWHLLNGKLILETFNIPTTDPFLYSPTARHWISDQWLSDLILYFIYLRGSWPALCALAICIFLGTFFLIGAPVYRRCELSTVALALAAFISFKLSLVHFILRPVIFSFLFFALVFFKTLYLYHLIIEKQPEAKVKREFAKLFITFPIVFAVWANLHPAFVMGILVLACLVAALSIDKFFFKINFSSQFTSWSLLLLGFSALATLFNPYFFELHKSILSLGTSEYFMSLNKEWRSINFRSAHGHILELTLILFALSPFVATKSVGRWRAFPILIILNFLHFALHSERMLPYYAIVIVPYISQVLTELLALRFKRLARFDVSPVPFVLIVVILVSFAVSGRVPTFEGEFGPSKTVYPYKAVEFLSQRPGQNHATYSTPNWGGFIAWASDQKLKPILDDRNSLLGENAYKDYFKVVNIEPGWRDIINESGAEMLLLEKGKPLANHLLTFSKPIFEDELSVVFDLSEP